MYQTGAQPKAAIVFPKLSPRQLVICYFIARGFSAPAIADATGFSVESVRHRIKRIQKRFMQLYGFGFRSREVIAIRFTLKFGVDQNFVPNFPLKDNQHA